nr:hypothetical protein [Tanacetum cinerariifolium]
TVRIRVGPAVRPQPVPPGKPKATLVPTGKPKGISVPTGKPKVILVPTGKPKVKPVPTSKPKVTPVPTDDFHTFHDGNVTFGGGEGRITKKGTIRTPTLDFENVYYVKER